MKPKAFPITSASRPGKCRYSKQSVLGSFAVDSFMVVGCGDCENASVRVGECDCENAFAKVSVWVSE